MPESFSIVHRSFSFNVENAFEDIYDDCSVVTLKSRSDNDVAEAVIELVTRLWDKDAIKEYSKRFESETMARKYNNVYQTIIEG